MKCPITNEDCPEVDTSGMDKIKSCKDCEIYKQAEIDAWNEFMMGL